MTVYEAILELLDGVHAQNYICFGYDTVNTDGRASYFGDICKRADCETKEEVLQELSELVDSGLVHMEFIYFVNVPVLYAKLSLQTARGMIKHLDKTVKV